MVKAKVWVKVKEFSGTPTIDNLKLVEEELPELKDGDVLFKATYMTVDPYMRPHPTSAGNPMPAEQVAKVVKSRNADYKVGTEWVCFFGWRTHTVFNPSKQFDNLPQIPGFPDLSKVGMPSYITQRPAVFPLPKLGDLPHSLALGTVGMPGVSAYLGLLQYGDPKAGETVLVNGAAGAVGHVVGQIAKLKGCKVIGYAGTNDKVKWLKELGFDFAYNYKKVNLSDSVKEAAPDGIDVYFDNVGGDFSDTILSQHLKLFGRAIFLGAISGYNATNPSKSKFDVPEYTQLYFPTLANYLSIHGFQVPIAPRTKWVEALAELTKWIQEGKLKYREHITKGFDKMPEAFFRIVQR